MRPGITIQHASLPDRRRELVRCDVGALIGFVARAQWPEDATEGDFMVLELRRVGELTEHPQRSLLDRETRTAVRQFFENGGELLHVFAVCIADVSVLRDPPDDHQGPLAPLMTRLRSEEDIGLIAVPGASTWRCEVSRNGTVTSHADALWDALLAHCREVHNRFLVIDAPRGLHGDLLTRWVEGFRSRFPENRAWGAVYYPWLMRGDAVEAPSGAIMGLMARLENGKPPFGIALPPANVELRGFTHAEVELDWTEVGAFTDASINPMMSQPGRGVVVWGARTLSRDPTWQFINSRRIIGMITDQLRRDSEWAVFEVNDPSLWKVLERDVSVRLRQLWEGGLIAGARALPEFSVHCNEQTNLAVSRDAGVLNVEVSLRPVGTTERILIDLRLGGS